MISPDPVQGSLSKIDMTKNTLIIALLSFIFLLLALNSTRVSLLLANTLAELDNYRLINNIRYGRFDNNNLDIYVPEKTLHDKKQKAVVVFFYGGCWGACMSYTRKDYAFVAQAFTSLGYSVVIPDYRHYPEHMFADIMTDAVNATTWVHNNIAKFSGDNTTRIILVGHSSGAHMAALLTLDKSRLPAEVRSSIAGFIGLAGPYDFLPFTEDYQPALFGPEKNYPASQPVNYVSGHDAPMLLLYGNDDSRVKPINIESLTRIAQQAGDDVESHRYNGIDHPGILAALSRPLRDNKPVMADIARFMDRIMKTDNSPRRKQSDFTPAI